MKISELANQVNLNASTIRYYERLGLLPAAQRSLAGYRIYHANDVNRLHMINLARSLGFNLEEIKQLFGAEVTLNHDAVLAQLIAKKHDIETAMSQLNNQHQQITCLITDLKDTWKRGECYEP